jgi:hypothetical protein
VATLEEGMWQRARSLVAAPSVLAPGSALGSVPTVALSSAQAINQSRSALARERQGARQKPAPAETFRAALDASVSSCVRVGIVVFRNLAELPDFLVHQVHQDYKRLSSGK